MELRRDSLQTIKGRIAFWAGALVFSASSFAALAITSRFVPPGTLAGISGILALSVVVAVVPGSVQIDRAIRAADCGKELVEPMRKGSGLALRTTLSAMSVAVLASAAVAWILHLDFVGTAAVGAQLVPAIRLSASRGVLMGSERFGPLGASYASEAVVRLLASSILGVVFGEAGFGIGILAATVVSLAFTAKNDKPAKTRRFAERSTTRGGDASTIEPSQGRTSSSATKLRGSSAGLPTLASSTVAIASALALANADLLTVSRRLTPLSADSFASAALPAKGVFLTLFVAGWMFLGRIRLSGDPAKAVLVGVTTVALGMVLGVAATLTSPLVFFAIGKTEQSMSLVVLLCIAMALASGTWALTNLAISLGKKRAWAPPFLGICVWIVASRFATTPSHLGVSLLVANYLAFVAAAKLTARSRKRVPDGVRLRQRAWEAMLLPARKVGMDPLFGYAALGAALVVSFLQQPKKVIADTKIDMAIDPIFFLQRALHMWEPLGFFGHVQNQSYGYFFPMGPFFAAAKYLSVPMWIAQRLWIFAVIATAFTGVCFLATRLGIGTSRSRVLAAAFYVTAPVYVSLVGFTSAAVLPGSLVPWMVGALIPGDTKWTPLAGASRSAAAFALSGAVNAAATVAVLPAVVAFFLTSRVSASGVNSCREESARHSSVPLVAWTAVLYGIVSVWWIVPLFLLRTYGFSFLQYTESAAAAASTQSLFESMRGSGYWLAYLNLRRPWLPGGWDYVSLPYLVVASGLATALGLAGLSFLGARRRLFAPALFLVGVAATAGPYWFAGSGLFNSAILALLTGPLGAFRNVSKFEFLVILPLALGIAHLRPAIQGLGKAHSLAVRRVCAALAVGIVSVCTVLMAIPAIRGRIATPGGFEAVPQYWLDAVEWLEKNGAGGRVAVVPGASFGEYEWGRPLDDVLQPLAHIPWAVRSLIPLGGTGSTRVLDKLEDHLSKQVASPGLAPALFSSGIRYLVVRNDLDWRLSGAPRPIQVKRTLESSGGFVPVASFGAPEENQSESFPRTEVSSTFSDVIEDLGMSEEEATFPKVVVYEVEGGTASEVGTVEVSDVAVVSGGPETRMTLDFTASFRGLPFVLASDDETLSELARAGVVPEHTVRTDDLRRRDHDYGLVHYNYSYTLGAGERPTGMGAQGSEGEPSEGVSRGGKEPREIMPATADSHKTTRYFEGAASIRASSYSSWLVQLPELRPYAAFDSNPSTAWVSGAPGRSRGEWIEIEFEKPFDIRELHITPLMDNPFRPVLKAVRVRTDAGSLESKLEPSETAQSIDVPEGLTKRLRIELSDVEGDENSGLSGAGIREVYIPGLSVREIISAPADHTSPEESVSFSRRRVHPSLVGLSDEEPVLRRSFFMSSEGTYTIEGAVVPLPGDELDRLIAIRGPVTISASSSFNGLPEFRPSNLLDGDTTTIWAAALPNPLPNPLGLWEGSKAYVGASTPPPIFEGIQKAPDPSPSLVLDLGAEVTLGELRVVTTTAGPVSSPSRLRLVGKNDTVETDLMPDGWARFEPITTRILRVEFPSVRQRFSIDSMTGILTPLPVGFSEIEIPALRSVRYSVPLPWEEFVLPCGSGPLLLVDGEVFDTEVNGTISDLIFLRPMKFRACRQWVVTEPSHFHRLERAEGSRPFSISEVAITRSSHWPRQHAAGGPSDVAIREWTPERRVLKVEPGPARILYINENFNTGWRARSGNYDLRPVRLEGWKQGFILPDGFEGEVELVYGPGRVHTVSIVSGLFLVALVVTAALLVNGMTSGRFPLSGSRIAYRHSWRVPSSSRWWAGVTIAVVFMVALVVSVPVAFLAAVLSPIFWIGRRRLYSSVLTSICVAGACGAFFVATLYAASGIPAFPADGIGQFGLWAQLGAGTAMIFAILPVSWSSPTRVPSRRADSSTFTRGATRRGTGGNGDCVV